jgi:hypothetical protein
MKQIERKKWRSLIFKQQEEEEEEEEEDWVVGGEIERKHQLKRIKK